ncbi:MAG: response regulator [Flavobacteriales bacterium]
MNSQKTKYGIVMLIDDNEIDNFINEKIISGCLFSNVVYVNTSTRSAIEFLKNISVNKTLREGHLPEYIFLDINMPILDGFQFLEEFKSLEKTLVDSIKIVMLTSSINPNDLERSKLYSFVKAFLHKPLTEESLADL